MDFSGEKSFQLKRKLGDSENEGSAAKTMCMSPWEFKKIKADLIQYQTQVIKLEDRIDEIHKNHKETVILFDKEKSELKTELFNRKKQNDELHYKLQQLRKREASLQTKLTEDVRELELTKLSLHGRNVELESENDNLRCQLSTLEAGNIDRIKDLREQLSDTKDDLARMGLDLEELKEHRLTLEAQLAVALQDAQDNQELEQTVARAHARIRELEGEQQEYAIAKETTCALRDRVLRLNDIDKELEAKKQEVAELRMAVANKVMQEELVLDLEAKLGGVAQAEVQLAELKEKHEKQQMEVDGWRSIAADFSSAVTAESLRDYIEGLQRKELTNSMEINGLKAKLTSVESTASTLQEELDALHSCNTSIKTNFNKLRLENQLLRKKTALLTRERNCYREQLDLFEKDLTLIGEKEESDGVSSMDTATRDAAKRQKERVASLEQMVEEYRSIVEQLESAMQQERHQEGALEAAEEIVKLKYKIASLEDLNKVLTKRKDELELELEERIACGEYPMETKVLHFTQNPAAQARRKLAEELVCLEKECAGLKARVKVLEDGDQLDITRKALESVETSNHERVKALEGELSSTKLQMKRFREFFEKTSKEFRDVSKMLLGYSIELVKKNQYRLTSMYSETQEDYFMFQQSQNKEDVEMLETPFTESLSQLVYKHLHKGNSSIPVFLAAVTLELHSTATGQGNDDNDDAEEPDDEEEGSEEADDKDEEDVGDEEEEEDDENEDECAYEEMEGENVYVDEPLEEEDPDDDNSLDPY